MTDTLFDVAPLVTPEPDSTLTIQERFEAFHKANPWVYDALEAMTRDWLSRGHSRAGIKNFFEVVRYEYGRQTTGDRGFRCNNDFTSRYARLLVERNPDWTDAIETRQLRAA